jgi:pseudouridine kinase
MKALTHLTPNVLALEQHYINAFDTLFIDTNLTHETLQYLFDHHHHQTLYVDTVSGVKAPKIKPFIKYVNVLKCTKEELSLLSDETQFTDQLNDLINQGLKTLIVTNKDQPITYKTAAITKTFEPDSIETIVSSSGAGDAFISGFIYGQLHHATLETSMAYAIRAASLTLMHPTSVNPSLALKGEEQ